MRRLRPFVAVCLVYLMTPMAAEITENLLHLVANGHTAHAVADEEHQPDDPEHCCSGPTHVCGCCHSTSFVAPIGEELAPAPASVAGLPCGPDVARADGYLAGVFRPPIV